jgi:Predicted signal transduction protein containing a membrane domain, an EAL and a GGDEF domain
VADRIREALEEPFDLAGTSFYASGSLGISLFPQDAQDAETLLKNADTAMYQSKKQEPGGHIVFATGGDDAMQRLSLTTRLREAVSQEHWVLHWQPIVEIETGKIDPSRPWCGGSIRTAAWCRRGSSSRSPRSSA